MPDPDTSTDKGSQEAAALDTNPAAQEAAGSGTLVTPGAQQQLETKLADAGQTLPGTGHLTTETAVAVSALLQDPATTPLTRSLLQTTLAFSVDLGPGCNVPEAEGARRHILYYRDLQNYFNNAPADFRAGAQMLLRLMNDLRQNGVFSERYLFRFIPNMRMENKDRTGLEMLFTSLVALSQGNGRAQTLKQIDLGKLGEMALNEAGTQNLIGFFSI
jgi:hypothetical protein